MSLCLSTECNAELVSSSVVGWITKSGNLVTVNSLLQKVRNVHCSHVVWCQMYDMNGIVFCSGCNSVSINHSELLRVTAVTAAVIDISACFVHVLHAVFAVFFEAVAKCDTAR